MIKPEHYGIVEMVFTGAVVLGLAVWQLWSVNRDIAKDKDNPSSGDTRHPVGEHRLDDR